MLLIDAVYIHESGGKELLRYLIESLSSAGKIFFLLMDERLDKNFTDKLSSENCKAVAPSEKSRKLFYQQYSASDFSSVLCFANVPPPQNIKIPVFVFFQNTLILSGLFEKNLYCFKQKLFFLFRRIYINSKNTKEYTWIVQTAGMKTKLSNAMGVMKERILVIPFFRSGYQQPLRQEETGEMRFLYVADGVTQKNHQSLLLAWEQLFTEHKLKPELHLTVPERFSTLCRKIKAMEGSGLAIINHGRISQQELEKLYHHCQFLVFPSLAESFGLPIIEAVQAGCMVLVSDLPYAHDIIKPNAFFNPLSAEYIAQSVVSAMRDSPKNKPTLLVENSIDRLINVLYN